MAHFPVVLDLFITETLVVAADSHPLDEEAHCVIRDDKNALVATVRDRVRTSRFAARLFGFLGHTSRYEWDVLDPEGNRVLDIVKPREGLRGPHPQVALANGTPIGHATENRRRSTQPAAPPVTFSAPDGRVLGELVPVFGEQRIYPIPMYRIHHTNGTDVGEIAIGINDDWGFRVSFHDTADIPMRALSVAYVCCRIQQQTTGPSI